jgi:hypothetical protein
MNAVLTQRLAAVVTAVLMASVLVVTTSRAAFSDTTVNPNNDFAAGDVVLTDNDLDAAMFSVSDMAPTDVVESCIEVTYDGSLTPADVVLYVAPGDLGGTGLAGYLDLTVERGTGAAAFGDCTGFTSDETVTTGGTLAAFAGAATGFASGAGTWAPAVTGEAVWYRFVVTLQDDNAAQGLDATVDFTWEAQNS